MSPTPLHQAVIDALAAAARSTDDVTAAFVSGSIGAGRADALSDVDCSLVFVNAKARDAAWSARRDWFARLGEVVTVADASHVGAYLQVGVMRGPVMVDLAYRTESELEPSPWYAQLRIVKDSGGVVARLQRASGKLAHPEGDAEALTNLTRQFWRWATYTARDVQRGDVTDALTCLNFIRTYALRRLAATAAGLPWHRFERLERELPHELIEHIRAGTPASLDAADLATALTQQLEAFKALRDAAQKRVPHAVDVDEAECFAAVQAMLGPVS